MTSSLAAVRLNKVIAKAMAGMLPPDDLTVTEWAEQNRRRRRFWKWVAIAAGICGLLLLPQLVLTLLMLGYGLPANSSIGIIGGADGPTAIFITAGFPWGLLFAILGCIALVILGVIMSRRPD